MADTITIPCKHCGKEFTARKPKISPDGHEVVQCAYTCPQCGNKMHVAFRYRTVATGDSTLPSSQGMASRPNESDQDNKKGQETVSLKGDKNLYNGRLVWGMFPFRKEYALHVGDNYVGRSDKERPSDLMIKDDYMSRRSVNIHVTHDENGYKFELIVENAANPIAVAGKQLKKGESLYLNFNDVIGMGNTKFTFKSVKK